MVFKDVIFSLSLSVLLAGQGTTRADLEVQSTLLHDPRGPTQAPPLRGLGRP